MLQQHTEEQRLSRDSEGARGDDGGHRCVWGSLRLVKGWAGTEHCLFSLVAIKVQSCENLTAPGPRPAPTSPSDTGPFLVTSKPAGVTEETKMSRSQGPSCSILQEITGKGQRKPLRTEQSWEPGQCQAGTLAALTCHAAALMSVWRTRL